MIRLRYYSNCYFLPLENFCLVPHVEGPCDKSVPRWAYDVGSKVCVPFNYSGCGGNENNFVTRDQCTQTCPGKYIAYIWNVFSNNSNVTISYN